MSVINTNIKSLISQNAMVKNNRELSSAMQQLSTGVRINSAADDAAGLAITSRMTSTIRGLDQSIRNANDGISMIQTAEGALVEVTNMLQRMREISVQAANDTYSDKDREYLNLEFQQLKQEINRVAENTEWNGAPILKHIPPNNGHFEFQVGANSGQKIAIEIPEFTLYPTENSPLINSNNFASQQIFFYGNSWDGTSINFTNPDNNLMQTITVPDTFLGTEYYPNDAISYVINSLKNGVLKNDYNFSELAGNGTELGSYINITPSASNPNPRELRLQVNRADASAEIKNNIYWGDGSLSRGVTAADYNGSSQYSNMNIIYGENVATQNNAEIAIDNIDAALAFVNDGRAKLGAFINRLTYAADNLANISQNTSGSRSRILDADYAKASSELARTQIIAQAATAMLAQANQQPQSVLKLLQG